MGGCAEKIGTCSGDGHHCSQLTPVVLSRRYGIDEGYNQTHKLGGFAESFESLFLVDTGATDSMAPSDELEKLGVKQEGKMAYELADGTVREYPFGLVRIEFMGETTAGRVIFAAPGTEPLLGVTALESVGIIVDPINKTLKRLPAIPLK
jgi:clan AA aspartic protease